MEQLEGALLGLEVPDRLQHQSKAFLLGIVGVYFKFEGLHDVFY